MKNKRDAAFDEGKRACAAGRSKDANPYRDGEHDTSLATAWKRGWLGMNDLFIFDLESRSAKANRVE